MKNILKGKIVLASLLFASVLFYSCQEDESLERKGKPTVTFASNTITVKEGQMLNLDFILSYAIKSNSEVRMEILSTSTADFEGDLNLVDLFDSGDLSTVEDAGGGFFGGDGYYYSIPSLVTNHTLALPVAVDNAVEGDETISIRFFSVGKGEAIIDQVVNITIQDAFDLEITFDWSGSFMSGGSPVDNCDLDMDLELFYGGEYFDTSYNDCPESIIIPQDAPDGTYILLAQLWTTNGYFESVNIPANITFAKTPINLTQTENISAYFPMDMGGLDDGNSNAEVAYEIVKVADQFTITNIGTSNQIFQGRMSNLKNKRDLKAKSKKK